MSSAGMSVDPSDCRSRYLWLTCSMKVEHKKHTVLEEWYFHSSRGLCTLAKGLLCGGVHL